MEAVDASSRAPEDGPRRINLSEPQAHAIEGNRDGLDVRRRRLLFRAWHRGTREMDLLMGRFADAQLTGLPEDELDQLEILMEAPDRDVFSWLTGEAATPGNYDTAVFRRLRAFHTHDAPLHG